MAGIYAGGDGRGGVAVAAADLRHDMFEELRQEVVEWERHCGLRWERMRGTRCLVTEVVDCQVRLVLIHSRMELLICIA
jgi:hypothetical protein